MEARTSWLNGVLTWFCIVQAVSARTGVITLRLPTPALATCCACPSPASSPMTTWLLADLIRRSRVRFHPHGSLMRVEQGKGRTGRRYKGPQLEKMHPTGQDRAPAGSLDTLLGCSSLSSWYLGDRWSSRVLWPTPLSIRSGEPGEQMRSLRTWTILPVLACDLPATHTDGAMHPSN